MGMGMGMGMGIGDGKWESERRRQSLMVPVAVGSNLRDLCGEITGRKFLSVNKNPSHLSAMRIVASVAMCVMSAACAHNQRSPVTAVASSAAERTDAALTAKVSALIQGFKGDVGIYARHLKSGRTVSLRANETFPTASTIKVPILVGTFDAIDRGQLKFQQELVWHDSLRYQYDDSLGVPRVGAKIPVSRLTLQMITESNNTSSLWLQGLVGGANINAWLSRHGFDSTRINSRVAGREANRTENGWGQSTPRELSDLVVMIREGRAVSRAASEEMYRQLTRIYWNGQALSQLPPWVQAASKQGMVDRSRAEVVLVNAPSGDYVFTIMTKNQANTSYGDDNDGYVLIRALSALLWKEFEPNHPFVPDSGARRYKPG